MPLYEYKCNGCGQIFSELRSIAEREEPIACPHCNGVAEVIISNFATPAREDGGWSPPTGGCVGPT